MESEYLYNTDNRYVFRLKIKSEEDLFVIDEATGAKKYTPITKEDVALFKREAEHLCKEIQYAIEDIQWNTGKHKGLTYYYHIYQDLAEQLTDFLKYIHKLHKKVYITIYKSYDNELMAIYTEILEKVLNDIQTIATVTYIYREFTDLYKTRVFRTDHEAAIIYHYIKRRFDEHTLPAHLEHVAKVQKRHLKERRIDITTLSLQKVMSEVEGKFNNYTLCSVWFNNVEDEENEEELVHMLVREEASPVDFENLFMYQGEHDMLAVEIARADEYERNGDSFFANWVDPAKLKKRLEFWLKGNITKQQDWYIVWCLMKYTFHMVKEDKDKSAFAARMNLMFPEVEKRCVVESFRKQETQMNHNRPFDEWLEGSDPDYYIAQELYYKLEKREELMRSFGVDIGK